MNTDEHSEEKYEQRKSNRQMLVKYGLTSILTLAMSIGVAHATLVVSHCATDLQSIGFPVNMMSVCVARDTVK